LSYELSPGDRMLLYTDGVAQGVDENGDTYDEDLSLDEFDRSEKSAAESPVALLMASSDMFVGEAPGSDDTTLLLIGRCAGSQTDSLGVTE
jgi:serine phosphatase RsbU (regulator of sigma subunit)